MMKTACGQREHLSLRITEIKGVIKMKKQEYEKPIADVIILEKEDVVTASFGDDAIVDPTPGAWGE